MRSGINPDSIINQLKGISGPNPTWEDGQLILSTPDAIGRALENFIHGDDTSPVEEKAKFEIAKNEEETNHIEENKQGMECIECNSHGVVNEGGCRVCKDCGWSKCQ